MKSNLNSSRWVANGIKQERPATDGVGSPSELEGPRLPTEAAPLVRKWWRAMASPKLALASAVTHVAAIYVV